MELTPAVVLINPKTPYNVGGVLRACAIFGVPLLRWTGERVHDNRELGSKSGTSGVSRRVWRLPREERLRRYNVDWGVDDGALDKLIDDGMTPVCVELVPGAETLPLFTHPEHAVYVFGPEDGHVPKGVRHVCHRFVEIPSSSCLNLAAAVNVILYDRAAKAFVERDYPICPYCHSYRAPMGLSPREVTHAEVRHMQQAHPDVIDERLTSAGFRREGDEWVDTLAGDDR